jgi:hypothetical protein
LIGCIAMTVSSATSALAQSVSTGESAQRRNESPSDDGAHSAGWVTKRDVMSLGAGITATLFLVPLDKPMSHEFAEPDFEKQRRVQHLADRIALLGGEGPFVASTIVAAAGSAVGPPSVQRFALHNAEAIALASIVNGLAKGLAGRALPGVQTKHAFEVGRGFHDGNGPLVSFPSGHTAAAFAMATTISAELKRADAPHVQLFSALAFGAASAVGVARVVQRVHWLSDLPVAAVIGIWSGRAVQAHSSDSKSGARLLRGVVVGGDAKRVRVGWSLRASDGERQ